ncbi:MAG: T9SS type A sorting domain-containing protein [Bacteroidales bacterium]
MLKNVFFLMLFPLFLNTLQAQDTIRMMHYNLLYYGETTSWCTSTNNNIDTKAAYITEIIDHTLPNIFTVNEMGNSQYAVGHLIGNALNVNGRNYYNVAAILNNDGSSIINMMYYDSRVLKLLSQLSVPTGIRDINIYKMQTLNTNEPVEFHVAIAHLKAGEGDTEEGIRADMISDYMDFLSGYSDKTNWIFAGDMNFYTSAETGFQYLMNPAAGNVQFADPVDQIGAWHNNYFYRDYHTQSTHSVETECPSYGGLDDRFDFIFVSEDVITGDNDMLYVPESYETLGQDGNHFNDAVNYGTNNSAPANVIEALYNASDHLPVLAEFVIGSGNYISVESTDGIDIRTNVNANGNVKIDIEQSVPAKGSIRVYNLTGQRVASLYFDAVATQGLDLHIPHRGMYILDVTTNDKQERVITRFVR